METQAQYPQKLYSLIFRHGGNVLHTMPLHNLTREEVKLLAFIHGGDAVDTASIKFTGQRQITMHVRAPEGHERQGQEIEVPVLSQMDEYKRLALKYDVFSDLDGIGRGRRYVEECFGVRLDNMDDSIFEEVDPIAAAEAAMAAAEAKAGGAKHEEKVKAAEGIASDAIDAAASGGAAEIAEGAPGAPSMQRVFERGSRR